MKKITKYVVLAVAFPFMLIGAIWQFALDAVGSGMDVTDTVMGKIVDWIER